MAIEKMPVKAQAEVRANLYRLATDVFEANGYPTQPIKGGRLIDLGEGYYGKISISVCDPDKVDDAIEAYAMRMKLNAERAAERARKEEEKARKAAERASKRNAE